MIGALYLLLALGCWTVWAVLSCRLCARLSPMDSLLWTGLVSAVITFGGFAVHHQQLRMPTRHEWWLLAIFCVANAVASFGYYAALRHLPGCLVLPVSHLYLVFGPVLLAISERRSMSWQQIGALGVVTVGVVMFLASGSGTAHGAGTPRSGQSAAAALPGPRLATGHVPSGPAVPLLSGLVRDSVSAPVGTHFGLALAGENSHSVAQASPVLRGMK